MSSQYGEHELILKHFEGRIGRFLDIGAFDGRTFSNTWPLAELGWYGFCVEPNPPAFCHLMKAYEGRHRVHLVNAAVVASGAGLTCFQCNTADAESADMMSSTDPAHVAKWAEAGHPFRPIFVNTITFLDLVRFISGTPAFSSTSPNFLNIDVEGMNLELLKAMPIKPEMLCYEWDKQLDGHEPLAVLAGKGYTNFKEFGGNLIAWL